MFICTSCNKPSQPREPQTKVVIEKRAVTYPNGGRGFETVREIAICHDCVLHSGRVPKEPITYASNESVIEAVHRQLSQHRKSLEMMGTE